VSEETTKKQEVTKPPFDPHKLLDQLKGIVENNKSTTGGGKSWLGTLVIVAVVLVAAAIWYWLAARRGRELAKLRHEKNKAKIIKEGAVAKAAVAENDGLVEKWTKVFDSAEKYQVQVEASIEAEEKRYEADMRAINSIRSWRDAGIRRRPTDD